MSITDYRRLSPKERLDLITEIWDSIEADQIPLTEEQAAELDRRAAVLDEDLQHARDADTVLSDLRRRYR